MFKDAKWISKSVDENGAYTPKEQNNMSVLARKIFHSDKQPQKAILNICALGLGVYSINGKKVSDDVLCTPFTVYDKRVIYQKYDVTEMLVKGDNAIGVHMGNGFYNENMPTWNKSTASWYDRVKLIARLDIEYADGSEAVILTDKSWKVCYGPCTYNRARQGEIYDFALAQKGFDKIDFDDANWENAIIARPPGGILEPMDMPPIRVVRTLNPVSVNDDVYDFGENISGWIKIKGTGKPGQKTHIKYEEWLNDDGSFFGHIDNFNKQRNMPLTHEEYVIFSGAENEEYAPSFCYHGFRYARITNAPADAEIVAEVVHTDLPVTASFECSDEMLCKIHEASVRSTLSNYHSVPTDCPHREQNPWTGDALISSLQCLKNFDMFKAYRKWLFDFKDSQRPSGHLPGIIPSSNWGYNDWNGPAWDSTIILLPLNIYEAYGDISIINDMWENMVLYMDYMYSVSDNFIVDYGLGDWCPPPDCDVCSTALTGTVFYYANARAMEKMAKLTGRDASVWGELAENIKKVWRKTFMTDKSNYKRQTFLACAIYYDLLDKSEVADFAKKLAELVISNSYHIDCGIIGARCIFDALSDNGYSDICYKMITVPTMPSYAYWINKGMTTFAESWNMKDSMNHHMYSEVDNWLYKHVGGFDLNGGKVYLKPKMLDGIDSVKLKWNDVELERNSNHVTVKCGRNCIISINEKETELAPGLYEYDI